MQANEGVIKFDLAHRDAELAPWAEIGDLQHWFARCRALDLVGRHEHRYQGAAYGNISQRAPSGFLITGTQTGGHESLDASDICWVQHIDLDKNRLLSSGPSKPSSESMTHEQVYRNVPEANFVIHVHHKPMWQQARRLGLEITAAEAEYGTPEMAREVERLLKQPHVRARGAFSMGGHEDGILVFGASAEQAGRRLEALFRQLA